MFEFLIFCFIIGITIYCFARVEKDVDFFCPYCHNTDKTKVEYVGNFGGQTIYRCLKCGNKVFD